MEMLSVLTSSKAGREFNARIDAVIIKANVNYAISIDLEIGKANDSITVRFHANRVLSLSALLDLFGIQSELVPCAS